MFGDYLNHFFRNEKSDIPKKSSPPSNKLSGSSKDDIINRFLSKMEDDNDNGISIIDIDNLPDNLPPELKAVFERLKTLKITGKLNDLNPEEIDGTLTNEFNNALGEPSEEHIIKKDGVTISRKIWDINNTEQFAKLTRSKKPIRTIRTAEDAKNDLEMAIEKEDFELAAKLRDEIKKLKLVENKAIKKKNKNN